jgi:aminoglycoside phosphotransferase family enzyme/predicted kinase
VEPGADDVTAAIVRTLADPAFHGGVPVEHHQTHLSHVFLAGPLAYKLKKPLRFPFVDYSTPEGRRRFCEEEVRRNGVLAPGVYLRVATVTRTDDGRIALDGDGTVVDHLVVMRRLPDERTLEALVRAGSAGPTMVRTIAEVIQRFHAGAPCDDDRAAPDAVRRRWDVNVAELVAVAANVAPPEDLDVLVDFGPTFVARHESLLRARQLAGRGREGHGDLRADHVYVLDRPLPATGDVAELAAGVYVVDCVEFSRDFRCGDVAADVGFLVMSLEALGRPDLARELAGAYAEAADDATLRDVLPFYVAHRACIRAKVAVLTARESEVSDGERATAAAGARDMLALALRHAWRVGSPVVVACMGLSGTGKSALAHALAGATGFPHLATDVIRAETPSPARYSREARTAVYDELGARADALLTAGTSVIADATYLREIDRRTLAEVAQRHAAPCIFLECRAPEDVVRRRLDARDATSLSDARFDTYLAQREAAEPLRADEAHVVVDTGGSVAAARAAAVRALWQWRQGRPLQMRITPRRGDVVP